MKKLAKLIAKKILPNSALKEIKTKLISRQWHAMWDIEIKNLTAKKQIKKVKSLIIFPADPRAIFGSLGDDAMISSVIDYYRSIEPNLKISMFCMNGESERIVAQEGLNPIPIPKMANFAADVRSIISNGEYDAFVAIGADVMDGYYSPEYTKQILLTADIASRLGIKTTITGFSFNEKPAIELAPCYNRLDKNISLYLRDPISLNRIKKFSAINAELVADAAFSLKPGQIDQETKTWIENEKSAGILFFVVNLHPMLIRNSDSQKIKQMIDSLRLAIIDTNKNLAISWLIIPHDYRDEHGDGDGICLRPLMNSLEGNKEIRIKYFEGKHRAATLKALAGHLDGIFSGRMHLAIAALGMGVPVLCLTYQDKFAGLFQHFRLPEKFLLSTEILNNNNKLASSLKDFIKNIPYLKRQIEKELPHVKEIARLNFH